MVGEAFGEGVWGWWGREEEGGEGRAVEGGEKVGRAGSEVVMW